MSQMYRLKKHLDNKTNLYVHLCRGTLAHLEHLAQMYGCQNFQSVQITKESETVGY